jgi:hypothetical protein
MPKAQRATIHAANERLGISGSQFIDKFGRFYRE